MKPDGSIDMIHCPEKKMLGVQFHPESVMTENGREILKNLLLTLLKTHSQRKKLSIMPTRSLYDHD